MTEAVITLAVALTVGIVWALRQTALVPDRFMGLISLVAGSGWAYALGLHGADIAIQGVQVGLMASGVWSGGKSLIRG